MAKRNENDKPEEQNQQQQESQNNSGSSQFPLYLQAAARLSTSHPLGMPRVDKAIIGYTNTGDATTLNVAEKTAVPGIEVFTYMPTLGVSKDATSALNRSAFLDFNAIRCAISGNRPYEPVDHMIYRVSVDGMRELYDYISRAYTIVRSYNALNLYRPRKIMEAMGLDFDNWNNNAANIYQWLCNNASALEPFPTVPIGSISTRRHIYNSYFFTDGDVSTSQTYIFNQAGFYSYEQVDQVKGLSIRQPARTFESYVDAWNKMYEALQSSSDVYTIAADIRRAFPERLITKLTPPTIDAAIEYVKLDGALTSIMNAITFAVYLDNEDHDPSGMPLGNDLATHLRIIDGGNGILLCKPHYTTVVSQGTGDLSSHIVRMPGCLSHLNFVEPNPDIAAILNAVRFHPLVGVTFTHNPDPGNEGFARVDTDIKAMGTELIISAKIHTMDKVLSVGTANVVGSGRNATVRMAREIAALSVFDWHQPAVYSMPYTEGTLIHDRTVSCTIEDVQNYVPLDDVVLQNIHDAILMAEFGLPS